jgi:hypothetical protein
LSNKVNENNTTPSEEFQHKIGKKIMKKLEDTKRKMAMIVDHIKM